MPEMGDFRRLTVGYPGQPDVALALLPIPGPPVFDAETKARDPAGNQMRMTQLK